MAAKKPLVISSGEIQQLQSGDYLSVPISGVTEVAQTNNNAGSLVLGCPVYAVAADTVDKAKGDASGTATVVGLVSDTSIATSASGNIAVSGILTGTTGQWDAVAGTTGGLTFNTRYYLSAATAGLLTATAPSTAGQYVCEIGVAISTTELKINIQKRILL